ncbi:MAG: putative motility protein [Lachnospiraceae bacterium]|nr:putative motility protein [Lachnospiraceae bacterium]
MDIPALSMAMAQSQLTMDFGVAMLSKSLDLSSQIGDSLTAMMDRSVMEQSVTPHLGANIDLSI